MRYLLYEHPFTGRLIVAPGDPDEQFKNCRETHILDVTTDERRAHSPKTDRFWVTPKHMALVETVEEYDFPSRKAKA